jgi:hypothetical protein
MVVVLAENGLTCGGESGVVISCWRERGGDLVMF